MQLMIHRVLLAVGLTCLASVPQPAFATFGATQVQSGVTVTSVFTGHWGPIFVTFSAQLSGCGGMNGGYISPSWPDASFSGTEEHERSARMLANVLFARAQDRPVEVRYRVNSQGTGWNNCAIDAVWVQ